MTIEKTRRDAKADQIVGKTKEIAGKITGNDSLENRGKLQAAAGKAKEVATDAAGFVAGGVRELAGKVQKKAGELLDDDEITLDGQQNEAKGKAMKEGDA